MKIINRLNAYITQKGLKRQQFEAICGMSNGYFGKQLTRNADIGESILTSILDNCPDINPEWLVLGNGQMLKSKAEFAPPPIEPPPPGPAVESTQVIAYLERKITEKETELKEAYYEIGRLNALVEQLKKDTNKGNYAPGTSELERKK
ncbi:MAG: hypothetical protein RBR35_07120 [Salinivirgaceae bacterium]|nr:hypothetical protein [Salinivirgaceae bacterium]